MAIYKDDMKINAKDGLSEEDWTYVGVSLISMLIFYGGITLGIVLDDGSYFYCILVIFVYWFFCCKNKTTSYLVGLTALETVYSSIDSSIKTKPSVVMTIQNYHYKTVRRSTKQGGSSFKQVRVDTHYATHEFKFDTWVDKSAPVTTLSYLEVLKMCRLDIKRTIEYFPYAKKRLDQE